MPNRVIKDTIWSSPTLAKLPLDTQLHWPRLLLMADDWGCFNADPDVIKGLVYPKVATMTVRKICDLLKTYAEAGLIFLWETGERMWGFFTSWHGHQFCNATHLSEDGKQLRHQRKTPEPPEKDLSAYLAQHKLINQGVIGKLEQVRALQKKYRNPNPNPNPNPSSTNTFGGGLNGNSNPTPPLNWNDLDDIRLHLETIHAPDTLYDPAWWRRIDQWLKAGDGGYAVSYLDELSAYLAWNESQPKQQQHKDLKRGLRRWLAKSLKWSQDHGQTQKFKAQYSTRR